MYKGVELCKENAADAARSILWLRTKSIVLIVWRL
nr:MAG TPA: hypothetical protein [Caudoviricetes sp.]